MFLKSCVLWMSYCPRRLLMQNSVIVLEIFQECEVMLGSLVVCLTSMCQIEEALPHYPRIGSTVTPFFPCWWVKWRKFLNGFSLMNFPFFYGFCGLKYKCWQAVKTTALCLSVKAVLSNFTGRGQQGGRKIHYTIVTKWTFIKINTVIS
jgi:hypothetical protein